MKLSLSCLMLASSLCAAACAHASTLSGTVYNGIPDGTFAGPPLPTYTNSATFNVTGAGIDFTSPPSNYTVRAFLNMPGFSNQTGGFVGTESLNETEIVITGSLSVATGDVLSVYHDDGAVLYLDGQPVITNGAPTTGVTDTYTAKGASSTFTLYYVETGGKPADLIFTDNGLVVGQTPEPSSLILLGTGLATAAGIARRRFSRGV